MKNNFDNDFTCEYIMDATYPEYPLYPLVACYLFTHQFTTGSFEVTFDNMVKLFKSFLEENENITWNNNNEIVIRCNANISKNEYDFVKWVLDNTFCKYDNINVDGKYISVRINELFSVKDDNGCR